MKILHKILLMALTTVIPQMAGAADLTIKVWDNSSAPHSNGVTTAEYETAPHNLTDITECEMTIYKASKRNNTGKAVVICPGGGYHIVSILNEGYLMAQWFAENGITAAVLKYRLPNGVKEVPFEDALEAVRIMRQRSKQLGFNPSMVGVVGSSAGGHLAASVSVLATADQKPNFSVLFYPVISGSEDLAHKGSFDNLLGKDRDEELTEHYSLDKRIDADTPPAILFHCNDDKVVPSKNSTAYYDALKEFDKHSALYIFPEGGHGWGCKEEFEYREMWQRLLLDWIEKL